MTEQLRKKFKTFLLENYNHQNSDDYCHYTDFVTEKLKQFFNIKINLKDDENIMNHKLFNFASGERTYINKDFYHYGKMDTLAERAKVGDLLFFQSDESENITNIAFYLGNLKMLSYDERENKPCVKDLYPNPELSKNFIGIKNIENFEKVKQNQELTK